MPSPTPSAPPASVQGAPGKHGAALSLLATLFFMWGFCTVLNDVLIPHLKAVFVMNYVQTMLIQFIFFFSYFLMSVPAAKLIEWVGYKASMVVGLAAMSAGCLLFIPAAGLPSYPVFLSALFVLAAGITVLQVAANPYVAVLGRPETSSIRLNLVQAFNSFGTFVAPTFGSLLILGRTTSGNLAQGAVVSLADRLKDARAVQGPYFGIAVVLLVLAAAIALFRLPRISTHPQTEAERRDSVWRHPLLVLGVVAIFLYVGAEVTVGSFMTSYIGSSHVIGASAAVAAKYITFYWGGTMVGRFIGSAVMTRVHPARTLVFNSIAAVVMIGLSMALHGRAAMACMLLVGLCNSIMFPTIFTLAIQGLGPLTGRASGFLIMAICGGGVLPLIQGALADRIGVPLSFVAPAFCYLYVLYFGLRGLGHKPAAAAPLEAQAPHIP